MRDSYDAVVVGSGPNGLCAAIRVAETGRSVLVLEAQETLGGGVRSMELTAPGCISDLCSAVHPMAMASPFLQSLPLEQFGLLWVHPDLPFAHPMDHGAAIPSALQAVLAPFADSAEHLLTDILHPLSVPRHPRAFLRFGLKALQSIEATARYYSPEARALWAGLGGHAIVPFDAVLGSAVPLTLALAGQAYGWPFPRGGAQSLTDALAGYLRSLGGEIRTGQRITSLQQVPDSRAVFFDTGPMQMCAIAGDALPARYRARLTRYRYGPGVFKMDFALDGPIPWAAEACRRAGTVHVGGSFEEIAESERQVAQGKHPARPFVLVAQQSVFDPTRAPAGKQVAWAYCHVPSGSREDMAARIEAQIERFAPGFQRLIIARSTRNTLQMQRHNENEVGGDIAGGAMDWRQLLFRPVLSRTPWATPNPRLFLCSAATPPGGGVHGMCGVLAADLALRSTLGK